MMERKEKKQSKPSDFDKEDIKTYREFTNHSEAVALNCIEKLISYSVTKAINNDIDRRIPEKCWDFMHRMLNEAVKLEYIAIDRDDVNLGNIGLDISLNKEFKKVPRQNKKESSSREESHLQFRGSDLNLNLLLQKEFQYVNSHVENEIKNHNKEDFSEHNDNMERESHLMHFNMGGIAKTPTVITDNSSLIFFDNKFSGTNTWNFVEQPASAKIDRAASTVIKVYKHIPQISQVENKDEIKLDQEAYETKNNLSRTGISRPGTRGVAIGMNTQYNPNNTSNGANGAKKKNYINPEAFPNFPIEKMNNPEVEEDKDVEDLRKMKKEEWKKKEEDNKVKQKVEKEIKEKENEVFKRQKEYERKNVTADVNGNIILIKAAAVEKFCNDFINPKSEILAKGEIVNVANTVKQEKTEAANKEKLKDRETLLDKITQKKDLAKDTKNQPPNIPKKVDYTNSFLQPVINTSQEKYEKPAITPAGSSFNYIMPEIGVTIIEGGQSKFGGGGRDYFKAFKKYSKYDYQTMLKDTNVSNYTTKDLNIDNDNFDANSSEKNSSLPKIGLPRKSNMNLSGNSLINPSFKTKYGVSLKDALDNLDEVAEYDENITNENENIFKQTKKDDPEKEGYFQSLEQINKFNLSIVKNSQWGTATSKGVVDRHDSTHFKPDLKEIEREVGKNIAKTKLPRSRVYTYVKSPPSMMNATSSGFNKTGKSFKKGKENKTSSNFNQTSGPDTKFSQTANENMNKKSEMNSLPKK